MIKHTKLTVASMLLQNNLIRGKVAQSIIETKSSSASCIGKQHWSWFEHT